MPNITSVRPSTSVSTSNVPLVSSQHAPTSATHAAVRTAIADQVLSESELAEVAATFEHDAAGKPAALWPLVELDKAISRDELRADPAARSSLRHLLLRELAGQGAPLVAKATLNTIGMLGSDGTIGADDANVILMAVRGEANQAAADKALGETYRNLASDGAPVARITHEAALMFEAHFAARGLPYGDNERAVRKDVERCLQYLKGRDRSSPPDTRALHEVPIGASGGKAFVDAELRRTWLRTGDTWYGPISLDRGPEGKTLAITHALNSQTVLAFVDEQPALSDPMKAPVKWIVGGPNPDMFSYAAFVKSEDATSAVVQRKNKANGHVDYCEVRF